MRSLMRSLVVGSLSHLVFQVEVVGKSTFKFEPAPGKPFAADEEKVQLLIQGTCTVAGLSSECAFPVDSVTTAPARRAMQAGIGDAAERRAAVKLCDIVNIAIAPTDINILGLVVDLPEGLTLVSATA
jgi:hypothetical protein